MAQYPKETWNSQRQKVHIISWIFIFIACCSYFLFLSFHLAMVYISYCNGILQYSGAKRETCGPYSHTWPQYVCAYVYIYIYVYKYMYIYIYCNVIAYPHLTRCIKTYHLAVHTHTYIYKYIHVYGRIYIIYNLLLISIFKYTFRYKSPLPLWTCLCHHGPGVRAVPGDQQRGLDLSSWRTQRMESPSRRETSAPRWMLWGQLGWKVVSESHMAMDNPPCI